MNMRQVPCILGPCSKDLSVLYYVLYWDHLSLYGHMERKEILNPSSCKVKDTPNFISSGSKIVKRLRRRQYDPLIIEMTIGVVLGPSTALYGPFLKHCTLTNKAVGTILWALSKPPQRRQGHDLRPFWLLVGTLSAIRPELAFSRAEHSLPYSDITIFIFGILYLLSMLYVYQFYDLSAWGGCWFVVYIRRFIYKFLNVCPFDYKAVAGSGKVGPVNQVNHTSVVAVVTPTDLSRSATAV